VSYLIFKTFSFNNFPLKLTLIFSSAHSARLYFSVALQSAPFLAISCPVAYEAPQFCSPPIAMYFINAARRGQETILKFMLTTLTVRLRWRPPFPFLKLFSYFSPPATFIIYLRWPHIILAGRRSILIFLRSLMSLHCLGDQLDWWRPLTAAFDMRSLTAQWVFIRFLGRLGGVKPRISVEYVKRKAFNYLATLWCFSWAYKNNECGGGHVIKGNGLAN